MSRIINLPSGQTATLRDPRSMKQKDRKALFVKDDEATPLTMVDRMIALLIEEWSFDLLPPSVKIETLDELDIADYDMLQQQAEEALPLLFPRLGKTPETEADPKAITGDSKD